MSEGETRWVPLFPLELVLFPGERLPLHIFEPRYVAMLRRCEESDGRFGIVLADEGKLARIGCEARLHAVPRRYDDGRLDLIVEGGRRIGLAEIRTHPDGYLEGRVTTVADSLEEEDREARLNLLHLLEEVQRATGDLSEEGETEVVRATRRGAPGYTYAVAREAHLDLAEQQKFLETASERERTYQLLRYLARDLPSRRHSDEIRRRVGGNGRLSGGT